MRKLAVTTKPVTVSVSELNTFHRCRRKYLYSYVRGLQPRKTSVALTKGTILHACLEAYYSGKDWTVPLRDAEAELKNTLFEEELPPYLEIISDAYKIMRGYINHTKRHGLDDFEILDVEYAFKIPLPGGHLYEGKMDLIVRDRQGIWIIDHKTVSNIPEEGARFTDIQGALYPWAYEQLTGEKPAGVIWNYIKSKPPKLPTLTQKGTMSKALIDTDWLTYEGELRKAGLNPDDYADMRAKLEGKIFYRREKMPRPTRMTQEIVKEAALSAQMIAGYLNSDNPEGKFYPRTVTRDCDWCLFRQLCHAELMGVGVEYILASQYAERENSVEEEDEE